MGPAVLVSFWGILYRCAKQRVVRLEQRLRRLHVARVLGSGGRRLIGVDELREPPVGADQLSQPDLGRIGLP